MATKVNHRRRAATQGNALRKALVGLGDIVTDGEYPYPITGQVVATISRPDDVEAVVVHSVYDGQDYQLPVEDVRHYNGPGHYNNGGPGARPARSGASSRNIEVAS